MHYTGTKPLTVFISAALFLAVSPRSLAQFTPFPDNTVDCGMVCSPDCDDSGGGDGGVECTIFGICPPDCDPAVQSCIGDGDGGGGDDGNGDDGGGPCEGADCGDNNPCSTSGVANGSAAAPNGSTGNPINIISGNKYKRQVDLAPLPGVLGLEFVRHYNSAYSRGIGLGRGWRHSYSTVLTTRKGFNPGEMAFVKLQQADGRIIRFDRVAERRIGAQYQTRNHLDGYITTTDYGYQWRWRSGRVVSFDERGLMTQIEENGFVLRLQYSGGNPKLIAVIDPQGRRLSLHYNDFRIAGFTDPAGNVTQFKYDRQERLVNVVRPDSGVRLYHYQDPTYISNLTGITDERGVRIQSYGYDELGRAVSSTKDINTERVLVEYDDDNNRRVLTDSSGVKTTYVLKKVAGQTVIADVQGPGCSVCQEGDVSYQYNAALQVTRLAYLDGRVYEFEYDQRGRLVAEYRSSTSQARRLVRSLDYNGSSSWPSVIRKPSIKPGEFVSVRLSYSEAGHLVSGLATGFSEREAGQFEPVTRRVDFEYDHLGRLSKVIKPQGEGGEETLIEWTDENLLALISNPDGTIQRVLGYTEDGRIQRMQINDQPPFTLTYDGAGNLTSVVMDGWQESGIRFLMKYDAVGNLIHLSGPGGAELTYTYDQQSRLVSKTAGDYAIHYIWSSQNQLLSRTIVSSAGEQVEALSYEYDAKGRLAQVRDHNGHIIESRTLNTDGYFISQDGSNRQRHYRFDDLGELDRLVHDATTTEFSHINGRPRIRAFTDEIGNTTQFGYDDFGTVTFVDSPDSGLTQYFHDPLGRLIEKRDALNRSANIEYSPNTDIHAVSLSESTMTVSRDENRVELRNEVAQDVRVYQSDRLQSITRRLTVEGEAKEFKTAFDYHEGRLVSQTLASGEQLNFHYDENGRLQSMSLAGMLFDDTIIEDIDLNRSLSPEQPGLTHEMVSFNYGNGTQTTLHRDRFANGMSLLRQLAHVGAETVDQRYDYLYNERAQIVGIDRDEQPFHRYRYDDNQALTFAMTPHALYGYAYDENNNRVLTAVNGQKIYQTYEAGSNQLTSVRTANVALPVAVKDDGSTGELGNLRFDYNDNGQPSAVYLKRQNRLLARYFYNSQAERVAKVVYGPDGKEIGRSYFVYENNRLVSEVSSLEGYTRDYVYAGTRLVALIQNGDIYSVHANHLGAPTMVVNEGGERVWQATYAPFGQAIVNSDPDKDGEPFSFNVRLPGQYEDRETRLHYNYYRYYEPVTGRYISSDPLGLDAGPNTYAYVKNDPVHYTDPLGLLLFAFDGTGNEAQTGPSASNVVHFRNAYRGDSGEMSTGATSQFDNAYYITGAGTYDPTSDYDPPGLNAFDAAGGGSMVPRAEIMFDYFLNYLELMQENQHWAGEEAHTLNIDTVGFSRGAATARLFANAIQGFIDDDFSTFDNLERIPAFVPVVDVAGFTERIENIRMYLDCNNISVNLRFIGLFDTVSHYTIDSQDNDLRQLPLGIPTNADYVAHAVAANENRADFQGVSIHNSAATGNSATRVELGFVGAHSDIGGGYGEGDLSDVALNWMAQQAAAAGLTVNLNASQREVTNPIIHSSEGVFPFINSDRDFIYANESQSDQAGNVAPNDSLIELINPQPTWSADGAYGLNAEDTVGMFDQSLMETRLQCTRVSCTEVLIKGEDSGGDRTLIGLVDMDQYRQILSQPPYNLNITSP